MSIDKREENFMTVNLKTIVIVTLALTLTACSSFKAERVDERKADEKAMKITDNWVDGDTMIVIDSTLKEIDAHPRFQKFKKTRGGKELKMFVGSISNNTSEAYFPVKDLEEALLNEISKKDEFILIDADKRDALLKEITYQNDGMVDPAQAKTIGKQSGADLMIFGTVNMKPEQRDGKTIKTYTVNFRLTDIQSSEEVCRTRAKVNKYSEQKASGW